ncbi:hypothetical protein F4778DRAFT_78177 [Xylariomycetidae sp. FL2044]|nr:hypothetical protein F4778DRAFT_78177 [Xylariomycetidae sp. FL2044]
MILDCYKIYIYSLRGSLLFFFFIIKTKLITYETNRPIPLPPSSPSSLLPFPSLAGLNFEFGLMFKKSKKEKKKRRRGWSR